MASVLEIARRVRGRQREEREEREESPPPPAAPPTFPPFPPFPPGPAPWDGREALRLMEAADGLAERLAVDGTHPEITAAAAVVTSAHATRDMETLRFAVTGFEAAVRRARQTIARPPTGR